MNLFRRSLLAAAAIATLGATQALPAQAADPIKVGLSGPFTGGSA